MDKKGSRRCVLRIRSGQPLAPGQQMAEPVNIALYDGEQIAIVGANGSGKSRLVDMMTGRLRLHMPQPEYDFGSRQGRLVAENIRRVSFRDSYGAADSGYYLQQRWHAQEVSEQTPTTGELLARAYDATGTDTPERRALRERLYDTFHLRPLLDKKIILLSSGELRKFTLTRTLLSEPRMLILEEPFIGLDAEAREQLGALLAQLAARGDLMLVLVLSRRSDVPAFVTHVVTVEGLRVVGKSPLPPLLREDATPELPHSPELPHGKATAAGKSVTAQAGRKTRQEDNGASQKGNEAPQEATFLGKAVGRPPIIEFRHVTIRYGERAVLRDLTWEVRQGDHWSLLGPNGSGKSLLLSLVCADNPQRYACDIRLFGVPSRGAGQSIWDVKRRIGYVSPELHRACHMDVTALNMVATGLNGQAGHLARAATASERSVCREALRTFGAEALAERPFLRLSTGEQRIVLLARAFASRPDLLLLDEPLHGLDDVRRAEVRRIIEEYCLARPQATLVIVTHYPKDLPACIDHTLRLTRQA